VLFIGFTVTPGVDKSTRKKLIRWCLLSMDLFEPVNNTSPMVALYLEKNKLLAGILPALQ
jgi:hypothetical protein